MYTNKELEQLEKDYLFIVHDILKNNVDYICDRVRRSFTYGPDILPALIQSCAKGQFGHKSHQKQLHLPELFENTSQSVLLRHLPDDWEEIDLGVQSDYVFDTPHAVVHIDCKISSFDNTSDFAGKIAVGQNQLSHKAKTKYKFSINGNSSQKQAIDAFNPDPSIPKYYTAPEKKPALTYAIQFVYPSLRTYLGTAIDMYQKIIDRLTVYVENTSCELLLEEYGNDDSDTISFDNPDTVRDKKHYVLAEGLFRTMYRAENRYEFEEPLGLTTADIIWFELLEEEMQTVLRNLPVNEIPQSISCISIPNGQLEYNTQDKTGQYLCSGKTWGKSARFYYDACDGFEHLDEAVPRVVFPHVSPSIRSKLAAKNDTESLKTVSPTGRITSIGQKRVNPNIELDNKQVTLASL